MKTYTISEAAKVLGISRQRVHQLIDKKRLPASPPNRFGFREILASDLREFKKKPRKKGRPPKVSP